MLQVTRLQVFNHIMAIEAFNLPTVLTTSLSQGPNGPCIPEVLSLFPDVPVIDRPGIISAWDDPECVAAIEKTVDMIVHNRKVA